MKKWLLHIFLVSMLGMLTASCSQNADDPTQDVPSKSADAEKVTIRFTIDLGEQSGMGSRAAWEGYDGDGTSDSSTAEEGIGNENYIDTSNLQVFLFNTTGTYIGGLKDMEANPTTTAHIYEIIGEVDVVKSAIVNEKLNCKIMVVANADAATADATSGKVTGYDYNAVFNHNVTSIPMWGIGSYEIDLIKQLQVNLDEPIYMLRSMAKVEVTLGSTVDASYTLAGARLTQYNATGYVVPNFNIPDTSTGAAAGATTTTDIAGFDATTDLTTTGVFREYDSLAGTEANPTMKEFTQSEEGKSYVIYVPEFDNSGDLQIELDLQQDGTLIYKEGTSKYTIYLNEYKVNSSTGKSEPDLNEPFDLIRNHWYRYTINSIERDRPLDLTLTVNPWNLVTSDLHYKTQGAAKQVITWQNNAADETKKEVLLSADKPSATFSFELSAPTGATWYAYLVPVSGDENAFSFSEDNTNGVTTTVSGAVGSPSGNLTIYAVKTSNVEDNNVARLEIIVVTNDGRSINVTDLLGGEYTIMQAKSEQ